MEMWDVLQYPAFLTKGADVPVKDMEIYTEYTLFASLAVSTSHQHALDVSLDERSRQDMYARIFTGLARGLVSDTPHQHAGHQEN